MRFGSAFLLALLAKSALMSTNVLTFCPIGGSHMFFMLEVSKVLSHQGFNVTLVSLTREARVAWDTSNENLHVITMPLTVTDEHPLFSAELIEEHARSELQIEDCAAALLSVHTDKVMASTLGVKDCSRAVLSFYQQSLKFFMSSQWQSLLKELDFKAIIAEERGVWAGLLGARDIPMVMVTPELSYILPKLVHNLPITFNREPSPFSGLDFQGKVGFIQKVKTFFEMAGQFHFAIELEEIFRPYLGDHNISSLSELSHQIDTFFVNDADTFSFPFLLPPSVVNIGTIGFGDPKEYKKPLPHHIATFLRKDSKKTVYLSFGSFSRQNKYKRTMYQAFVRAAQALDIKIIISAGGSQPVVERKNVLLEKWIPQKALLGSGLISVFISSCGNNARLEAIYHTVPLICVPLYGEQPMISNIVQFNGHGVILTKEDLSEERISQVLNDTFRDSPQIRSRMERSVDLQKLSPVTQEDMLGYHVRKLVLFGKVKDKYRALPKGLSHLIDFYNIDLMTFGFILLTLLINVCKVIASRTYRLFLYYARKLRRPPC